MKLKRVLVSFELLIAFNFLVLKVVSEQQQTQQPIEDEDYDDEDTLTASSSINADSDGTRIYKNPRNFPSSHCPRDEERNQKCLRKCSSDEDCKSKKKRCLCDGICGMSCIKPDRECPELTQPETGAVILTGRLFGDKATYSCPHGFHVVGLQVRSCQADGQWSGLQPTCKQNIYCLSPPEIDHARHNAIPEQTTFDLDTSLQYFCTTGYVTDGFLKARCLAVDGKAAWYGPDINCEPRSCGLPQKIQNGFHTGDCYTYGCKIFYHCSNSYELIGKNESVCESNGAWSLKGVPDCVLISAVQCPIPENPENGKAVYTALSYNSIVSYECKYGHKLDGEITRRCKADQKWSGKMPLCKEINCGHPGRLWNGWIENLEGGTGLGASVIFRCNDGTKLLGNSSSICQSDGKWRYPVPECLAPCVVPQIEHGHVQPYIPPVVILNKTKKMDSISKNETTTTTTTTTTTLAPPSTWKAILITHENFLSIFCDKNYEYASDGPSLVRCNNGTWSQIPKCYPASCQYLPKYPKNGMAIAPKMTHGSKAKFSCRDGFIMKGNEFVSCEYGRWVGPKPLCQEVFCSFPGLVENGKILLVGNMGLYDYRSYVHKIAHNKQIMYDCNKGYVIGEGPSGATCIAGKWRPPELPKCVPGSHPRLRWSKRRRRRRRRRRSIVSKRAQNDTEWKRRTLKLVPKSNRLHDCEIFLNERTVKSIDRLEVLTSQSWTNWSEPLSNKTIRSETIVRLHCRSGYKLNLDHHGGSTSAVGLNVKSSGAVVKCVRAKWRPALPQCLPNSCTLLQIENGYYLNGYRSGLTIAHGSSVTYQCNDSETDILQCHLGKLVSDSDRLLICNYIKHKDVICSEPNFKFSNTSGSFLPSNKSPENISVVVTKEEFYKSVYRCKSSLDSKRLAKCTNDGQSNSQFVKCDSNRKVLSQSCLFRNHEPNVLTYYNDQLLILDGNETAQLPHLATIISRCVDIGKFQFSGSSYRQCIDGKWTGKTPSCFGLNQQNEYAIDKSPTILISFRTILNSQKFLNGYAIESNDGKLVVYPGTIVFMDCLCNRRFGNPKWLISHSYRKYPEKWALERHNLESEIRYRLVIDHAASDDTGRFTCLTPANHSHFIDLNVKKIDCPKIIPDEGNNIMVDSNETKLGSTIRIWCRYENPLRTVKSLTCQASGNWSQPLPKCQQIGACPYPGSVANGRLKPLQYYYKVGENVTISCLNSYRSIGSKTLKCLHNGQWSNSLPICLFIK